MNKREVLIILNKLKDVADNIEDTESILVLNQSECRNLLKYMFELKKQYDSNKEFIDNIVAMIMKRNSEV